MKTFYLKSHFWAGISSLFLLVLTPIAGHSQPGASLLAPPASHPKFVNDLPGPAVIDATNGGSYTINMMETTQWLGLVAANGTHLNTTVWGYGEGRNVTFPGPTFEAMKDVGINVKWNNKLPNSGHLLPVDVSLHMAHPAGSSAAAFYAAGNIPTVAHLHGGHTESASDGLPEAWFTQNFKTKGPQFVKKDYHYDNSQESATLWYHDHALGITRLNVYAGLAGFYLLRDDNEMSLINSGDLPSGEYEREIVIQDRNFDPNGELFIPAYDGETYFGGTIDMSQYPTLNPADPTIVAEFFGDYIIVNGMAWPKLNVQQTHYRFRMLNGSDSRVYKLLIHDENDTPIEFYQIGTEDGLMDKPVAGLTSLVIAPGERADLVVDFTGRTGSFTMVNMGPDGPYDGDNATLGVNRPTGQIMRFDVQEGGNPTQFSFDPNMNLRPLIDPIPALPSETELAAMPTRKLALFEGFDQHGRLQPLLGVINGNAPKTPTNLNGTLAWFEPITERPALNTTEVWEVYNTTEDAHPIHLHLVAFQIIDRTPFASISVGFQNQVEHDGGVGEGGYIANVTLDNSARTDPAENEVGWKDTFVVPPGSMGRVIATFDRPGRYVWHCHILSHEDHEMMRPFYVDPFAAPRVEPINVITETIPLTEPALLDTYPNPFREQTNISFFLSSDKSVVLDVYDLNGQRVKRLINQQVNAGNNTIQWDGTNEAGIHLPDGMYLLKMQAGDQQMNKQILLNR